ncbi:WxcM-like domain-containing protein, partial [Salmonella enterica]
REMSNFTSDCVLMVLADQEYNESDYIRDYEQFKQMVK